MAEEEQPLSAAEVARKTLVCVIDGNPRHQAAIAEALISFYEVIRFGDGLEAIRVLEAQPPAAIVLDEQAPPTDGVALLAALKANPRLRDVPVVFTSTWKDSPNIRLALEHEASASLLKPFKRSLLIDTISKQVNQAIEAVWETVEPVQRSALKKTVSTFNHISDLVGSGEPLPYAEVKESCAPLVEAVKNDNYHDILKGVRGHDNYSYVHSLRVATFLSLFGHTIGIRGDDLGTLATGGLIHDIGKMEIPHAVLNKAGRLDDEEWTVMRSHVPKTLACLERTPGIPKGVMTIAAQHHEKLDGTGYPNGLQGREMNELARMASIVDIFGALTDRRVYKPPMAPEEALKIMAGMTREVDQHLLAMFRSMLLDATEGTWDA